MHKYANKKTMLKIFICIHNQDITELFRTNRLYSVHRSPCAWVYVSFEIGMLSTFIVHQPFTKSCSAFRYRSHSVPSVFNHRSLTGTHRPCFRICARSFHLDIRERGCVNRLFNGKWRLLVYYVKSMDLKIFQKIVRYQNVEYTSAH